MRKVSQLELSPHLLLFSGGVDSLAADLLAPNYFLKVAVDWNGRFDREKQYFSTFENTSIVSTNLRDIGDSNLDWMFMASPAFLLNAHIKGKSLGFGSILEASPSHWSENKALSRPSYIPASSDPRSALKLFDSTPTKGLTEFGTMLVVNRLGGSQMLENSIRSAADYGSEKHFRKLLMRSAVEVHLGHSRVDLPLPESPLSYSFGKNFTVDMNLIVFRNLFGRDFVANYVTQPGRLTDKDFSMDVSWIFKRHPAHRTHPDLEQLVASRLLEAGIKNFSKVDWQNYLQMKQKLWNLHRLGI